MGENHISSLFSEALKGGINYAKQVQTHENPTIFVGLTEEEILPGYGAVLARHVFDATSITICAEAEDVSPDDPDNPDNPDNPDDPDTPQVDVNDFIRLSGSSRYDTMEEIVKAGNYDEGGAVIIATGSNYPDALAAGGLAGLEDAPILLTNPKSFSYQASYLLGSLKPQTIYITGGSGAVSEDVATSIEFLTGITPVRIYGDGRYDTAVEIYKEGLNVGSGWGDTVIVATGAGYADALSISPLSYAKNYPIILASTKNGLSATYDDATQTSLVDWSKFNHAIIVGGTGAVSADVEQELAGYLNEGVEITRLYVEGGGRYDTSQAIAEYEIANEGMTLSNVSVATGANFPDALASGPLCGKNNSVLLLASGTNRTAIDGICNKSVADQVEQGYVFGGTGAVSDETKDYVLKAFTK